MVLSYFKIVQYLSILSEGLKKTTKYLMEMACYSTEIWPAKWETLNWCVSRTVTKEM
jgi:hypothetical protein